MKGKVDLMETLGGGVLAGCVAETVLSTKLFGDLVVNLSDVLIFLDLEEAAAGLLGHAFQDLFAIDVAEGRIVAVVPAAIASSGIAATGIPTAGITTTSRVAATWIASARVTAATVLVVVLHRRLFAFEVDGVDDSVGALGSFDGFDEGFLAVSVDAVGQDNDGLPASLFVHEFVGGKEEGVVEGGATATAAGVVVGAGAGRVDLPESLLEERARGGEVLQKLYLTGELRDECLIFGCGEHLVEEGAAGGALFVEDAALGAAGVHEKAEDEREVGVLVEVTDGLGFAVDLEDKIIFGEVLDEGSLFVADDDRQIDEAGIDGDRRGGRGGGRIGRGSLLLSEKAGHEDKTGQKEPGRTEGIHVDLDGFALAGFQSRDDLTRRFY